MNGLVVKIVRMCERGDSGARELRREEKRKRELRHYFMASKFMRYVEGVVGLFYSSDEQHREER